ncbi:hypothetical protein PPACK8108_LOCUS14114 [Phakopsora pachyrhizi]|uniref:Uncharacterized protein n=1 Tax=Phakopsora pachyrhizi TaxID=170000 RepID=A0AAV0B7Q6_PHAPC|nr:hypothetical protein PPACK8108_LOCUS14114 [Phakopsora pachyrhizi]
MLHALVGAGLLGLAGLGWVLGQAGQVGQAGAGLGPGQAGRAGAWLGMKEGAVNELRSPENVVNQDLKRCQAEQVGQAGAWLGWILGWVLGRQGQAGAWLRMKEEAVNELRSPKNVVNQEPKRQGRAGRAGWQGQAGAWLGMKEEAVNELRSPENVVNQELKRYKPILYGIRATVNQANQLHIMDLDSPHEAFEALELRHGSKDGITIASAITSIVNYKFDQAKSITKYVSHCKTMHNKLFNMTNNIPGFRLSDNTLAVFMLNNLPRSKFEGIIHQLFDDIEKLTVKQVLARLLWEAVLIKQKDEDSAMIGMDNKSIGKYEPNAHCFIPRHKNQNHTNAQCYLQLGIDFKPDGNWNNCYNKPWNDQHKRSQAHCADTMSENTVEDQIDMGALSIESAFVVIYNPELKSYSFTKEFIADSGASIHSVKDRCLLSTKKDQNCEQQR